MRKKVNGRRGVAGEFRLARNQPAPNVYHTCSFRPLRHINCGHYSNRNSFFIRTAAAALLCLVSNLFFPTEIGAIPTYQDNHLEDDRFSPGFLTIGQKYR